MHQLSPSETALLAAETNTNLGHQSLVLELAPDPDGSELTLLDAALVSQALGHAATPAPFLTTAVMAPVALRAVGGPQVGGWLGGIASGELVCGVAATETFSIREGAGVALDGGVLLHLFLPRVCRLVHYHQSFLDSCCYYVSACTFQPGIDRLVIT